MQLLRQDNGLRQDNKWTTIDENGRRIKTIFFFQDILFHKMCFQDILFHKMFVLNNSYRLLTDYRIKYLRVAQRKPTASTDGIRKLPTTHLATSSARKLCSSVRREEIMRHDNERRREYITNNSLLLLIHCTLVVSVETL